MAAATGTNPGDAAKVVAAAAASAPYMPSWLLLSGGEDGWILWDLVRSRPLLIAIDESEGVEEEGASGSDLDSDE